MRRLAALALVGALGAGVPAGAQSDRASEALARLGPAQRVGQVFLVAYYGSDSDPKSDVGRLVRERHIGGIVLQTGGGNIVNEPGRDVPGETARLTAALQTLALGDGGGVPLFVAVDHEGNGRPLTHLRQGFTGLPSAMALGATWRPDDAAAVGNIVGRELAAVGVNMLLGPVLDVLAAPAPRGRTAGDIGIRSFGGDGYWVARMGRAYVRGVHEGGGGRVATVAKHFPGHGGSDRLPDSEVATVDKNLEDLRRVELPPFEAVTLGAPGPEAPDVTDGVMTSHIRYRGFQGDIRRLTDPISFDADGLAAFLALDGTPFGAWHEAGGLIVSDSLGVKAVQRFFDPTGNTFRNRDIARTALMAGNDVLVLAEFARRPAWSEALANIEDTLDYFVAQYERDREFRRRVDDAALRVLRRKAAIYPEWAIEEVAAEPASIADALGGDAARGVVADITRRSVAALGEGGLATLAERPRAGEHIAVITDDERTLGCESGGCAAAPGAGATLVEDAILARYGPEGTGLIDPSHVASITFCQLKSALRPPGSTEPPATPEDGPGQETAQGVPERCEPPGSPEAVRTTLERADWILIAFSELNSSTVSNADAVDLFLTWADVYRARGSRLVALSFGPPYYHDTTSFNKWDAYIAAFTKDPTAIDAAVEALFGDLSPAGAPPVSVVGAGYDLIEALQPDPGVPLGVRLVERLDVGDRLPARLRVEVGPIVDHNGHAVPDGTPVEITLTDASGDRAGPPVETKTALGIARADVVSTRGGLVSVHAAAGGARSRDPLTLELPVPTATPPPTRAPTPVPVGPASQAPPAPGLDMADLLLALATAVLVGGPTMTARRWRRGGPKAQLRAALLVAGGALAAYLAYGLAGRPWGEYARADIPVVALAGALAGLGVAWWRSRLESRPAGP